MDIWKRTIDCGKIRKENIGQTVRLNGWVHRVRDHGGLIFLDMRDRTGLVQVIFDPVDTPTTHKLAESLRSEFCIAIEGVLLRFVRLPLVGPDGPPIPSTLETEAEPSYSCEQFTNGLGHRSSTAFWRIITN